MTFMTSMLRMLILQYVTAGGVPAVVIVMGKIVVLARQNRTTNHKTQSHDTYM